MAFINKSGFQKSKGYKFYEKYFKIPVFDL